MQDRLSNAQDEYMREIEGMSAEIQRLSYQMQKIQTAEELGGGVAGSSKVEKNMWQRRKVLCQNATSAAQKYVAVKLHAAKARDVIVSLESSFDLEEKLGYLLQYINNVELLLNYLGSQVENSLNECSLAREAGQSVVLRSFEQSVFNKIQSMRVYFEDLISARR